MRKMDPTDENFPIKMDVFMNCIENISAGISDEDIIQKGAVCQEHLIMNSAETVQKNGFSMKLVFEMDENSQRNVIVEEVMFYDDMDEWLDALNRINARKNRNDLED